MARADSTIMRTKFKGDLVYPGHPRYDDLRTVFNQMIDQRPAIIARCATPSDVAATVRFARDSGMPLSVYGGGHGVTGTAVCDGIVADLRPMKDVVIDQNARTARAGAGLTWGEFDAVTQLHGLAVTGGRVSTTGVAGLILGSGSGWLERKFGYTADNLLSVEMVTADGEIVTASQHENADLFWGTRGGGGNFGAVTAFDLRLHPVGPTVLGGMLLYPADLGPAVLTRFRDFFAQAPDEVGGAVALITAPPAPFVPDSLQGRPAIGMVLTYAGAVEDGESALRPLRDFGPPAADLIAPMPYTQLQQMINPANPSGLRNYWSAGFLRELSDDVIDALCGQHLAAPSPFSQILVIPGGGAIARVPDDRMAFGQRQAPFNVHVLSMWTDQAEDGGNIAWARQLSASLGPFLTGRVYLNYIADQGEDRVRSAYGPQAYARLQELKDRYDPQNLFRSNQNIRPSADPAGAAPPRPRRG